MDMENKKIEENIIPNYIKCEVVQYDEPFGKVVRVEFVEEVHDESSPEKQNHILDSRVYKFSAHVEDAKEPKILGSKIQKCLIQPEQH